MSKAEEFAKIARTNEELCAKEVQACLQKYGCSMHQTSQYVDGQLAQVGFMFKFQPNAFLNPEAAPK